MCSCCLPVNFLNLFCCIVRKEDFGDENLSSVAGNNNFRRKWKWGYHAIVLILINIYYVIWTFLLVSINNASHLQLLYVNIMAWMISFQFHSELMVLQTACLKIWTILVIEMFVATLKEWSRLSIWLLWLSVIHKYYFAICLWSQTYIIKPFFYVIKMQMFTEVLSLWSRLWAIPKGVAKQGQLWVFGLIWTNFVTILHLFSIFPVDVSTYNAVISCINHLGMNADESFNSALVSHLITNICWSQNSFAFQ